MPKFTPSADPKLVVYHDPSKKIHVKFDDDSEDETSSKRPENDRKRKLTAVTTDNVHKDRERVKKQKVQLDKENKKDNVEGSGVAKDKSNKDQRDPNRWLDTINRGKKATKKVEKKTAEEILEKVRERRRKKKAARAARKEVDGVKVAVPVLHIDPSSVKSKLDLVAIRNFVLFCLAQAETPTWAKIINKSAIQHVALLFVDGLDITYFGIPEHRNNVPDYVDLKQLDPTTVGKSAMPFFTSCFSHMFISKLSGSKGKLKSAVSEVLQCPVSNKQKATRAALRDKKMEQYKDNMREYYLLTLDEMIRYGYPIPPCLVKSVELKDGWKETKPAKSPVAQKRLVALDCEMVETASGPALARVTVVDEDNKVLLDEFVKPEEPIVDYKTEHSGITPEIMEKTTCSFKRAQKHVRKLIDHNVILVGHGLENDLRALKLAHPHLVDTAHLYDSWKGPPSRPKLRELSKRFLKRLIQGDKAAVAGEQGHDSCEDAIAALDLFKLKLQKGPTFGRLNDVELVFDRLHQCNPPKTGAILDSSPNAHGAFKASMGSKYVHCESEAELAERTIEMVRENNLVFSRFYDLRPRWNPNATAAPAVIPTNLKNQYETAAKLSQFDQYFRQMYNGFPPGTVIMVMSGASYYVPYYNLYEYYKLCHGLVSVPEGTDRPKWTSTDQKRLEGYGAKARLGSVFATLKQ